MPSAPAIDIQLAFTKTGGTFSMPHRGYTLAFSFTDISQIEPMLIIHGVHCDLRYEIVDAVEAAFEEHCRITRESRRQFALQTIGGTGVVLACIVGAAAWIKGIEVIFGL
jgi:hypothetical protein